MKTVAILALLICSIGCISPFQPAPEIIGSGENHIVTTGSIGTGLIRWSFPATGGKLWVRHTEMGGWEEVSTIPSVSTVWNFDECAVLIIDPAGTLRGCFYKLSVWR